jgi:hypothetical protein
MTQPRYHTVKLPMRLGRIRCTEPEALLGAAQRLFSSTGAERPGGREHRGGGGRGARPPGPHKTASGWPVQ